jgi:hypothetical protein
MDEIESTDQEPDSTQAFVSATAIRTKYAAIGLLIIAITIMLVGSQAALFYAGFGPRLAAANSLYSDLLIENAQGRLFNGIGERLRELENLAVVTDDAVGSIVVAADNFHDNFMTAPYEAIETLRTELPVLGQNLSNPGDKIERLGSDLDRLREIYSDPYKDLMSDLENPPLYLLPTAAWTANRSGYRDAATLNRALYLAQVGEIGTARVLLTGLYASTDDPQLLGLTNYTLGRLQFELMLSRPEVEFYTQSVLYLRQSLQADPDSELARRFFDYLLSLSQSTAAPEAGEGTPTNPSEGEGAAISPDKRKF